MLEGWLYDEPIGNSPFTLIVVGADFAQTSRQSAVGSAQDPYSLVFRMNITNIPTCGLLIVAKACAKFHIN